MTITISLTPEEQRAFLQLLDIALRHSGAAALDVAAHFKAKLAEAERSASCAKETQGP